MIKIIDIKKCENPQFIKPKKVFYEQKAIIKLLKYIKIEYN